MEKQAGSLEKTEGSLEKTVGSLEKTGEKTARLHFISGMCLNCNELQGEVFDEPGAFYAFFLTINCGSCQNTIQ